MDPYSHPEWIEHRKPVLERSGGTCEQCKTRKAVHVHHLKYHKGKGVARLLVAMEHLLHVCLRCHQNFHPGKRIVLNWKDQPKERPKPKPKPPKVWRGKRRKVRSPLSRAEWGKRERKRFGERVLRRFLNHDETESETERRRRITGRG